MKKKAMNILRNDPEFMEIHFWTESEKYNKLTIWVLGFMILFIMIYLPVSGISKNFNPLYLVFLAFWIFFIVIPILYLLYKIYIQFDYPIILILDAKNNLIKCSGGILRKKIDVQPLSSIELCYFDAYGTRDWTKIMKKPNKKKLVDISFKYPLNSLMGTGQIGSVTIGEMYELRERIILFFLTNNYKIEMFPKVVIHPVDKKT